MIRGNIDTYLHRFAARAGLDRSAVHQAGSTFRRTTTEAAPRIAAMLDAMADGAGVPVEDVYAL